MKISMIKPYLPGFESIEDEFREALTSGMVTNNGHYVSQYEEALQHYLHASLPPVCYCNGEMALFGLIQSWKKKLGYSPHDSFDVLVPSFTFSGTVNAILMNNLQPIFCDVDETLTIDINKIDSVGSNTKMIIPVGVYGNLPDIEQMKAFAEAHNLVLVFDNAPAFGATYKGAPVPYYNVDEIYSFHVTKIYSSMEGGVAVSNDEEVQAYLARFRDFGQYEKSTGDVDIAGLNGKMQEVSAIVGLKNLQNIDTILEKRNRNIQRYREFFGDLEQKGYLQTMKVRDEVFCPYLYFPVILNEEASSFMEHLKQNNIASRRYYTSVHTLKLYKDRYKELNLDFTNAITGKIVALPIHTIMEDAEIDHLFSVVSHYFQNY